MVNKVLRFCFFRLLKDVLLGFLSFSSGTLWNVTCKGPVICGENDCHSECGMCDYAGGRIFYLMPLLFCFVHFFSSYLVPKKKIDLLR